MGNLSLEARSLLPFHNFSLEWIWESDQSRKNLAFLYRPPFALVLWRPFEKAKDAAKAQNKWLLVNIQSTREFSSCMLNRDTWVNEAVAQIIVSNFIFWQDLLPFMGSSPKDYHASLSHEKHRETS